MRNKTNNKLKQIHIFDEIWTIGKPNKKFDHAVIYGPTDNEYHLNKQWINFLLTHNEGWYNADYNDSGDSPCKTDRWNLGRVKAYILSHIIDPGLWNFDVNIHPEIGSNVKVIYDNGTIKWIESFSGDFKNHNLEIKYNAPVCINQKWCEYRWAIKKDDEEEPSQYIWEEKIRTESVLTWKIK